MEQPVSPRSRRSAIRAWGIGLVGLVVALAIGWWLWSQRTPLPADIVGQDSVPVYAAARAPEGYRLQADQTKLAGDTLTYQYRQDSDMTRDITVTVQPRPTGFDMAQMTEGGSIATTATDAGTLYNLSAGQGTRYLLDAGDALVFYTSTGAISTATMTDLAKQARKLN